MQLIGIIILSSATIMMCSNVHAHSRYADAEGQPYNCHDGSGSLSGSIGSGKLNENARNLLFFNSVSGKTEARYPYIYPDKNSYVKVDWETEDMVCKSGLDKQFSLDNVQQALFFSHLMGKKPAVVIYDTDGKMGWFKYSIESAREIVKVVFLIRNLTKSYMTKAGGYL